MRTPIAIVAFTLCQWVAAQEGFRQVLQADPFLSHGYFIVDTTLFNQIGLDRLEVQVVEERTRAERGAHQWTTEVGSALAQGQGLPAGPTECRMGNRQEVPPLPLVEMVHGLGHAQQTEL